MSKKQAVLVVRVAFEGDYYGVDEIVSVSEDWIHAGFEDRDNVAGVKIEGFAEELEA